MNALGGTAAIATGRGNLITIRQRFLLTARFRVLTLLALFALVAMGALARIFFIGVAQPASSQTSMAQALMPERGEITDRNGVPLARAYPAYALWFNPKSMGEGGDPLVKSPAQVTKELAAIFPDLDQEGVLRRLKSGKAGYLQRRVLPEDANKVLAIGELGLETPRETARYYPQGSMAAHVLGYVGADGKGRVGMEGVLDEQLRDPATRSEPVPLSIDMRVQGALEDELRKGMLATRALGAAGIILDVDTGEVLALASLPEFNPNEVKQSDVTTPKGETDPNALPAVFNKFTNQVYELGSTFKPLTVAIGIDEGTITDLGRTWRANEPLKVGNNEIKDSHYLGERLNVPQTLMYSSNITTGKIAKEIGGKQVLKYFKLLGFHERPYIELKARGAPLGMKDQWTESKNIYAGFGHGISVTPLHLASAYAAMVNGGIWRPTTLHKIEPGEAPKGRRVFKASTSARMNQMLRMISVFGTGKSANAPGFRVGGKTGSAEKSGVGGPLRTSLVSTFAAAFPMDRPRYVIITMLDEPQGTAATSYQRTAAWNAAPVVGKVVPRVGPLLGVMPKENSDVDISDLRPLVGGR